jgi:hypothetical protein
VKRVLGFVLLVACERDHVVVDAGSKIEDALARESQLPRARVSVTNRPLSVPAPSIVFVLAAWSVQSMMALRQLTTILAADPLAPPFLVVDTDDEAAVSQLEAIPSGAGETFWVRDGKIVARITHSDEFANVSKATIAAVTIAPSSSSVTNASGPVRIARAWYRIISAPAAS